MRQVQLRAATKYAAPLEFERPNSCAEQFSRMWREGSFSKSVQIPLGMFGALTHVLDARQMEKASRRLAESVRELCILDIKNHHAYSDRIPYLTRCDEFYRAIPSQSFLPRLSSRFHLKNSRDVAEFLEANHFLVDVLFEVRKQFDSYFGADTRSSLEVFTDPEDNHSAPKLFALVLTALPFKDASSRLDRLDNDWWLRQPNEVKRAMNIDIEYL